MKKVKIKSVKALKGKKIKVVIKSGAYGPRSTKVKVKVKNKRAFRFKYLEIIHENIIFETVVSMADNMEK